MNLTISKSTSFLLIGFAFILIESCTDKKETNSLFPFQISGNVLDHSGKGMDGIIVTNETGDSSVTDSSGYFQLSNIFGQQKIRPKRTGFTFEPEFVTVNFNKSKIQFTGKPSDSLELSVEKVYKWLEAIQLSNGLLESSENSNFVSLYDNALAAFAFMAKGDRARAEAIFDFFDHRQANELLTGPGGFSQFRDRIGNPFGSRWMGDNAWLLMALNHHASTYNSTQYAGLRMGLENWIRQLQDADGGIRGGFTSNNSRIGIVTEGMIDAFNAVPGYDLFHKKTLQYLHVYSGQSEPLIPVESEPMIPAQSEPPLRV
jgi:cellulose synthase operon protein B